MPLARSERPVSGGGGLWPHVRAYCPFDGDLVLGIRGWSQLHQLWVQQINSALNRDYLRVNSA
jgi:hypothetical protein